MTGSLAAVSSPTWSLSTSASPRIPNKNERGASALTTPVASLARLLNSVIGAPRSKIKRYGPLPLIRASTSMWLVGSISNGTTTLVLAGFTDAGGGCRLGRLGFELESPGQAQAQAQDNGRGSHDEPGRG